eukprot:sb/3469964/
MVKLNYSDPYSDDATLILPLFTASEVEWNRYGRAFAYFLGLLYMFLGVNIIADVFMSAIEVITSKTKKIKVAVASSNGDNGDDNKPHFETIEVKIWNDTVSNLTLMALGSSAPEILLSIIEIVGNSFEPGELGPGTIVGSASFNLLIITAVLQYLIPDHDGNNQPNIADVFAKKSGSEEDVRHIIESSFRTDDQLCCETIVFVIRICYSLFSIDSV